jgi:hypothetical protein
MAAEAHHLVADGVLEAQHDTHRHQHHGQSYCHTEGGNVYGRAAHLVTVALVAIDSPGYE